MVSQNAIGNTVSDNDFSVNRATAGTAVVSTVAHSDNTNTASNAKSQLTVAGTSGGDPATTYTVTGGSSWSHGIDNTDADKFILAASTALGTTNVLEAFITGEVTLPLQPAFLAFNSVTDANQTGNNTDVTVDFDTEVYDVGSDFATDTFTAPVTGKYLFGANVVFNNVTTADLGVTELLTSNREYGGWGNQNPGVTVDANTDLALEATVLADMDAADTAAVIANFEGQGADTVGIFGIAAPTTFYWGKLEQ